MNTAVDRRKLFRGCAGVQSSASLTGREVCKGKEAALLSLSNMIRWGGLATLLARVLFAISDLVSVLVLDYENLSKTAAAGTYAFLSLLYLLSAGLLTLGLVGLYAHQSEAAGTLGLVAFLVTFVGAMLAAGGRLGRNLRCADSARDGSRIPRRGGAPRAPWHRLLSVVRPCRCGVAAVWDSVAQGASLLAMGGNTSHDWGRGEFRSLTPYGGCLCRCRTRVFPLHKEDCTDRTTFTCELSF